MKYLHNSDLRCLSAVRVEVARGGTENLKQGPMSDQTKSYTDMRNMKKRTTLPLVSAFQALIKAKSPVIASSRT